MIIQRAVPRAASATALHSTPTTLMVTERVAVKDGEDEMLLAMADDSYRIRSGFFPKIIRSAVLTACT